MRRRLVIAATTVFLGVSFMSAPVFAMGGSGDSSGGSSKTVQKCKKNQVWDKQKKKCVDPKQGMLDDESIFEAGRDLAYAGRYDEAINVLTMAANKEDPRILNYMGYNTRKLGNMALGMTYYKRALQKDENYILARSYMGQALIEQGDIEGARVQLVEIRDRGGEGTWAYRALLQSLGGERTTY